MGKKKGWLSALIRVFTGPSKEKIPIKPREPERRRSQEKKRWGIYKFKHKEVSPGFFPLHREPSSVEKILEDAQVDIQLGSIIPPTRTHTHHTAESKPTTIVPSATGNHYKIASTRIQAAFRGHMARKRYRALKSLIRIQCFLRGQNVKNQTVNAMRYMQMLLRIQSQIRSRRLQMMNKGNLLQNAPPPMSEQEDDFASTFTKWSFNHQSEVGRQRTWDDSVLTKEELETRLHRKVEATIKRERAISYAYSQQQLFHDTPTSAYSTWRTSSNARDHPTWHNWIHNQLHGHPLPTQTTSTFTPVTATPTNRHVSQFNWPIAGKRIQHNFRERDNDSLTSCPAFSAMPNYMTPTVSAKAKIRSKRPGEEEEKKKGFSIGWRKGKGPSKRVEGKHRSTRSIGSFSMDSMYSMPVRVVGGGFEY